MILTGTEIGRRVEKGDIVIEPFDEKCLEPNAYGFHLGDSIMRYGDKIIEANTKPLTVEIKIPEEGLLLEPGKFYLACTYERMGGTNLASELYANLSTALNGIFIQTSAPLGHTGAIVHWTLEIVVAHGVIIYPRMRIGKICFWENFGSHSSYGGRYNGSNSIVASRMSLDFS